MTIEPENSENYQPEKTLEMRKCGKTSMLNYSSN